MKIKELKNILDKFGDEMDVKIKAYVPGRQFYHYEYIPFNSIQVRVEENQLIFVW